MESPDPIPGRTPRTPEKERAMALANERRQALLARARRIRRSVAALTATLFSVAFLVIYVQLASGHDPALVANAKRAATEKADKASSSAGSTGTTSSSGASTPTTSTESSESDGSSSASTSAEEEEASSTESSTASNEESSGASAVTTSQS